MPANVADRFSPLPPERAALWRNRVEVRTAPGTLATSASLVYKT